MMQLMPSNCKGLGLSRGGSGRSVGSGGEMEVALSGRLEESWDLGVPAGEERQRHVGGIKS